MRLLTVVSLLGLAFAEGALAQEAGGGTRLLRSPTVSRDLVALAYAGDLWVVSRAGGAARRSHSPCPGRSPESILRMVAASPTRRSRLRSSSPPRTRRASGAITAAAAPIRSGS